MEGKIKINYVDIASISSSNTNPKKAWAELLHAINNIYINFKKSQIDPEELHVLLVEETSNTNGVPDVASIDRIIQTMRRYINEYKIPYATSLFLDFKRIAAIYFFAIGSQDKAVEILKEIINSIDDTIGPNTNESNLDINMVCVKDSVKLNLASIHFWLEEFDESRQYLEKVITEYESTDNELYLIKMVNFVSVAFTYLAWIYAKKHQLDDAEKAFVHALKVISTVKTHSKEKRKELGFINTKAKKIFIYDQIINFYSFIEQFENCQQPLCEILKIMDKKTFTYDIDITPVHHVNYYITACLYALKTHKKIDFNKALHYLCNVICINYRYSDYFENMPPIFFEKLLLLLEAVKLNSGNHIFMKELEPSRRTSANRNSLNNIFNISKQCREEINTIIDEVSNYLDEIIAKFDAEKTFSLNPSSSASSIVDSLITLERFGKYMKNNEFGIFNHINEMQEKQSDKVISQEIPETHEFDEIQLIKITTERMLLKFANLIKDLVDCKNIHEKIVLEGLNGFLVVENEEIVLFSIYRFMARDSQHAIYEETKINQEDDVREKKSFSEKKETLKVFIVKKVEHKYPPLYYKRITFKLVKDAKTFNFPVYFALINLLYCKKLYQPCITLLSLFLDEVSSMATDLYEQQETHQKTNAFLHLYEFLLFIHVYLLCTLRKFDRALFELLKIRTNVNEVNTLLYKTLLGLCLTHCYYFDIAIVNFSQAVHLIKPLVDEYKSEEQEIGQNEKNKNNEIMNKKTQKTPETYLIEIRMFMSFIQCFTRGAITIYNSASSNGSKICFRCRNDDSSINCICLNCKRALYCNKKCLRKNRILHDSLCKYYLENNQLIKAMMNSLMENYILYEQHISNVTNRRKKDNKVI
jgi:tetratricopeptide (TPR) repeat protein